MVSEKQFGQIVRYKTLRYLVLFVITFASFVNIFFLLSTKFSADDDTALRTINARTTDVIGRETRVILPHEKEGKSLKKSGLIKNIKKTVQKQAHSLSSDINSDPQIPLHCLTWCRHGEKLRPPYQLSAVLLVRVYRHDLAGLSSREMLQWLYYLRYAGFEHVFVYDAYVGKIESQYHVLFPLVQSGYITYTDWSTHNPYTIKGTQISAYQDCINKHGKNLTWHMAIDIDEYPFSPIDIEPNFMQRFLRNFSLRNPHVSQVTLQNHLFLGKPLNTKENPLLIAQFRRRTHKKANDLGKSVFQVSQIDKAQVHHNHMRQGRTIDCDAHVMRLNHYWGARLQDWGEDTPRVLDMTELDYSIKPIVDRLNRCSKCFGVNSLYIKRWN